MVVPIYLIRFVLANTHSDKQYYVSKHIVKEPRKEENHITEYIARNYEEN